MNNLRDITGMPEYDIQFWNTMRGFKGNEEIFSKGRIIATNSYALPVSAVDKISTALKKESVFRNLATVIKAYNSGYLIKTKDCTDMANFISENTEIPVKDGRKDFNEKSIESYKLAAFVKLDEAFVKDAAFSIENYLTERFAKNFGRAEDNYIYKPGSLGSFINNPNTETDDMVNLYAFYVPEIALRIAVLEVIGVSVSEEVKNYVMDEHLDWIKLEKHLDEECVLPMNVFRQMLEKLQNQ